MGGRFTLGQLAEALQATLDGDPTVVVTGVAPLEAAGPEHVSFLTDPRYRAAAQASRAAAILVSHDVEDLGRVTLRCKAPRESLIDLLTLFHPPAMVPPGIDPRAVVAAEARVHPTASVGPFAVVGPGAVIGARARLHALVSVAPGAEIGADSVLYEHVVVRERVRVGRRVIVHPGAVIGADGFGFVADTGRPRKIPQVGGVLIEDDVEIGANTCIDRGTLGDTVIRAGVKLDNLVQIGHNVEVGENALMAAQVGISGSSRIGRGAVLGGQVGVGDHLTVGDGARVGAQSGVAQDVPPGEKQFGYPARPTIQALRIFHAEEQLPALLRRVRALERRVAELEAERGGEGEAGRGHD
ncbi:MAG: UDP-3-O-(3-hydroxymyristoyl)glucosamine N-acyltransferase [Candidatus Rokubacteria bacterium]|nr:UDP-3-O-(3-hydroxymyristoyl)glucosamine N-acyltransferase [Candidatus Rokubacteria bacterium]MBI3827758.1 UDP-3-O-(3-hydroxymyristoyl)glucosamine N-acyltransferase [Candidatus Rokubacteria bacterium]